ncbi:MAG: hypothetical protein BGO69_15060 [Bacteroidetes bacterium 46-16]|nr:MAG: hypothetical protein BGO69_15060 [Bacteroidetes bacterium 46-16]
MCRRYLLEWLDSLITVSLNPRKTNLAIITEQQIEAATIKIAGERDKLQSLLKNHVFGLTEEKQIELFIKQYHSALIILLDQASQNHESMPNKRTTLRHLSSEVINCLDELLFCIESRFSTYLPLDERVPLTYLSIIQKELKQRIKKLETKLSSQTIDHRVKVVVLSYLNSFLRPDKKSSPITFHEMSYVKELLYELELIECDVKSHMYSPLDRLLIYLNFNSSEYMNCFTQSIADKINAYENLAERMDYLLFHFKEFNQLHRKAETALHPQQNDLKQELTNWFTQEVFYLEKKLHFSIVPFQDKTASPKEVMPVKKDKSKVLCVLSTDQAGIILRAADELKILIARSLNEVFKTIVPHLSTPYKEELSYDSMRSKSYAAEERDKEIAIETLEKIIEKIRSY